MIDDATDDHAAAAGRTIVSMNTAPAGDWPAGLTYRRRPVPAADAELGLAELTEELDELPPGTDLAEPVNRAVRAGLVRFEPVPPSSPAEVLRMIEEAERTEAGAAVLLGREPADDRDPAGPIWAAMKAGVWWWQHYIDAVEPNPFDKVKAWADGRPGEARPVTGKQRVVLVEMIDAGGRLPLANLADLLGWAACKDPATKLYSRTARRISEKLEAAGLPWALALDDGCAVLLRTKAEGTGPGQISGG